MHFDHPPPSHPLISCLKFIFKGKILLQVQNLTRNQVHLPKERKMKPFLRKTDKEFRIPALLDELLFER